MANQRQSEPGEWQSLQASKAFQRFSRIFCSLSEMRIRVVPPQPAAPLQCAASSPFCLLARRTISGRANCQTTLDTLLRRSRAKWGVHCTVCAGGLHEAAVPVVVSGEHIATLLVGGLRDGKQPGLQFHAFLDQLAATLPAASAKTVRPVYTSIPCLSRPKFRCLVEMIAMNASHLGERSRSELLEPQVGESRAVKAGKEFAKINLGAPGLAARAARHAGLSRMQFSRLFKQATGLTFMTYLNRLRLDRATRLLLEEDARIIEVADASGFQSVGQFNRFFKKQTGLTPSAFRAANRKRRACLISDTPRMASPKTQSFEAPGIRHPGNGRDQ